MKEMIRHTALIIVIFKLAISFRELWDCVQYIIELEMEGGMYRDACVIYTHYILSIFWNRNAY